MNGSARGGVPRSASASQRPLRPRASVQCKVSEATGEWSALRALAPARPCARQAAVQYTAPLRGEINFAQSKTERAGLMLSNSPGKLARKRTQPCLVQIVCKGFKVGKGHVVMSCVAGLAPIDNLLSCRRVRISSLDSGLEAFSHYPCRDCKGRQ